MPFLHTNLSVLLKLFKLDLEMYCLVPSPTSYACRRDPLHFLYFLTRLSDRAYGNWNVCKKGKCLRRIIIFFILLVLLFFSLFFSPLFWCITCIEPLVGDYIKTSILENKILHIVRYMPYLVFGPGTIGWELTGQYIYSVHTVYDGEVKHDAEVKHQYLLFWD